MSHAIQSVLGFSLKSALQRALRHKHSKFHFVSLHRAVKSVCYWCWHAPPAAHSPGGSSSAPICWVTSSWRLFGPSFNLATGYAMNTEYTSNSPSKKARLSSTALALRTNDQPSRKPPPSLKEFLERTAKLSTLQISLTPSTTFSRDTARRRVELNLDRKETRQIYLTERG